MKTQDATIGGKRFTFNQMPMSEWGVLWDSLLIFMDALSKLGDFETVDDLELKNVGDAVGVLRGNVSWDKLTEWAMKFGAYCEVTEGQAKIRLDDQGYWSNNPELFLPWLVECYKVRFGDFLSGNGGIMALIGQSLGSVSPSPGTPIG